MGFWNAVLFKAQNCCLLWYIPTWFVFGVVKTNSMGVIGQKLIKPKQAQYTLKFIIQFGPIRVIVIILPISTYIPTVMSIK